jgi:hypothetical protein
VTGDRKQSPWRLVFGILFLLGMTAFFVWMIGLHP